MVFKISKSVPISTLETCSNKGRLWMQFFLSILASIPFFTHGVQTAELSVTVHSGHFLGLTATGEVPWTTTALVVAAAVSAPVYCYMIDRIGRRSGIFLISLAQGASCIPMFLPQTEISDIIFHVLAGISNGGLFVVLPAYIREISDSSIRGVTLSITLLMMTAGYLVKLIIDLEAMMFLLVALVGAQFLSMFLLVESPDYLILVGKIKPAEKIISKLTSLPVDNPYLLDKVKQMSNECERVNANGKITLWRILNNPIYRDITKIGLVLNTAVVLGGSIVFLDQDKALQQLKMDLDSEKTLVLGCLAAGCLCAVLVVQFLERKIFITAASVAMVLSMGLLAIYSQVDLTVRTLRWVPVVSLGVLVYAFGVFCTLTIVVMPEMLNIAIRSRILTLVFIYSQILKLAHLHTFQYVEQNVGIYPLFYIFCAVNMFGGLYGLFSIPKVKNQPVRRIEKQLKRVPLLSFGTDKKNTIKA